MTIAQQVGQRHEVFQNAARLGDFARLMKCLMLAKGVKARRRQDPIVVELEMNARLHAH